MSWRACSFRTAHALAVHRWCRFWAHLLSLGYPMWPLARGRVGSPSHALGAGSPATLMLPEPALLCCPIEAWGPGSQVLQLLRVWDSSPALTSLSLVHPCLLHQGPLHCVGQARYIACSTECYSYHHKWQEANREGQGGNTPVPTPPHIR